MYISSREKEIINILLTSSIPVSIQTLSDLLNLSSRTIYREIKSIENVLLKHNLKLSKASGIGMTVEGSEKDFLKLKEELLKVNNEFTQRERLNYILSTLLTENDVIKLLLFADNLNVTIGTISNDLTKAENWLDKYNIKFIRRQGLGITIEASEEEIRKALVDLLVEEINECEFLEVIMNPDEFNIENKLKNLSEIIDLKQVRIIQDVIKDIEKDFLLTDNSLIMLTIHLQVMINRIIRDKIFYSEYNIVDGLRNVKEYLVAKDITKKLEKYFNLTISDEEIANLTMILQGARFKQRMTDWLEEDNLLMLASTRKLVHYVSGELNINFINDEHLYHGLLMHLIPAVHRVRKNIDEKNPLVDQIKQDYPILHSVIKKGMSKYFKDISFSDDEVAYLVLYFGSSQVLSLQSDDYKALVICSSGIGTSKMLASRIRMEIKEITQVDTFDLYSLKKANIADYDIVISTVEMTDYKRKYLLVNPLLNNEDIERIQKEMKLIIKSATLEERLFRNKSSILLEDNQVNNINDSLKRIKILSVYANTVTKLLTSFNIEPLVTNHKNSNSLLEEICGILYEKNVVKDSNKLIEELQQRELKGGIAVPDTQIALYHCQTQFVDEPLFYAFDLVGSVSLKAMDSSNTDVTRALIMLTPSNSCQTVLEVFGKISSTIIEDEETIDLFTLKKEEKIKEKLLYIFEKEIAKKLK